MSLQEIKEPQFLNIIYPSSANIEENYNMQQDMFLFINSKDSNVGFNFCKILHCVFNFLSLLEIR